MKPITILWSDGISETDAKESIGTMREFLRFLQDVALEQDIGLSPIVLRPFGDWVLQGPTGVSAYHSFRWYWESSLDQESGQVSAAMFIEIVRYEPWQQTEPHLDLVLLHSDLRDDLKEADGGYSSVFACSEPDLVSVISTHHLAQIADQELRNKCLRSLVRHNFGRLIGLPNGFQDAVKSQSGELKPSADPPSRTCATPCIMYEAQSIDDLMAVATTDEDEGLSLCRWCQETVRSIVFRLHFSPN
jgi:hypothetical protein